MTDRIHSITLILAKNIRIDDAQSLINAVRQFSGVVDVIPNIANGSSDSIISRRAKSNIRDKLYDFIKEELT